MFVGVVLMPRSAIARREEGAYRQYSTPVENGLAPACTGWIGGQNVKLCLTGPIGRTVLIRPIRATARGVWNEGANIGQTDV